ncbi:MAG: hypothetical protein QOI66_1805 [Myxococcales bacterium]|nr:hypothetical protein [Myxococcales bacterium]
MRTRWLWTKSFLVIVAGAGTALVAAVGCAPDTDLTDERTRGDSAGADLGPTGAGLVDPPPGAGGVPPNLAGLVIRFGAPVTVPDGGLSVCASDAGTIRSRGAAEPMPCDGGGSCYRVGIAGSLPPGTTCRVTLEAPLARDDGSMVAAGPVGQFDTAAAPDQSPPQLTNVMTTLEAGCLGVTLTTDEPVTVEALVNVAGVTTTIPVGAGTGSLDLAIPARDLVADADGDIIIRATDRAGNGAATEAIALHTPPAAPPVVITEVLANPAGKEPVQEFVELRNIGDATVSLEGLRLEDSRGGDVLPAVELAAGGYAVVVGAGYDPFSPVDVQPRATAVLVRLDTRIGSDGLSNSGEAVHLRAAGGPDAPVISSYGGWVDVSATAWSGRSVRRAADEACDRPASWNRTPLAATPGW